MSEGAAIEAVVESLMDLENNVPGSCEALIIKCLRRLQSSQDPSLKRLCGLAVSIFKEKAETSQEPADGKKQLNAKKLETPSLSPLARFLLSRWQNHDSQELSS